jgi:polar amino acid transport system permease protein
VRELTAEGKFIAAETFKFIEIFAIIAIIYLVFTVLFTAIIEKFEKKLRIPGIGATAAVKLRKA